jgi:hypothetical protein
MPPIINIDGAAESDSYINPEQCDAFLLSWYGDGIDPTWTALSEGAKEHRLRVAALLIGMLPLRGYRSYRTQGMDFPRQIANCPQSNPRRVPQLVREAQALIAYGVVHRGLSVTSLPSEGASPGRVSSISLSGLLSASFGQAPISGGNVLAALIRSEEFPIFAKLRPFMAQARIVYAFTDDEQTAYEEALYTTTTTDSPWTTTTTEAVTTTTSA